MGRDKLLLEVCGVPLLCRVRDALATACGEILVVGEGGAPLEGVRRVPDLRPGAQGPLAGMEAGLAAAGNPLVFVAAGDMPFLSGALISYLLERLGRQHALAVVSRHGGKTHPLCAAYDRSILPHLTAALDEGLRAVHHLLSVSPRVEYVGDDELERFGSPDLFLMNVNSPEELQWARLACGEQA